MNKWTELSIEYANQKSYLDDLFRVYPTIPEGIRNINTEKWNNVEQAFTARNNSQLISGLLELDLFPIKDSYVAYLRKDSTAIERNPQTINRICGRLYELGINEIYERCSEPKETNRQIGPMFRDYVNNKNLGIAPVNLETFMANDENAILSGGDKIMADFAKNILGYNHEKGLDFVGRFNKHYVIGEAKFLTDFGGHQNAQFNDAISTIEVVGVNAIKVAILDGVLYINKSKNKMCKSLMEQYKTYNIMSSLVFRDFLYSI